MKKYRSEKTMRMAGKLKALSCKEDETLKQVANIILEKVEFYDRCLASWDSPKKYNNPEDIEAGRMACNAALDMADAIVNELRIFFIDGEVKS